MADDDNTIPFPGKPEIMDKFWKVGALRPCPACGAKKVSVMDRFAYHSLSDYISEASPGDERRTATVVTRVCQNCGLFSQYSAKVLGLV